MTEGLLSPSDAMYWLISGQALFLIIHSLGIVCFCYIVMKRVAPLIHGERDLRFDRPWLRLQRVAQFWFAQWKHPRYKTAGTIHILIFSGFLILATRAFSLLIFGAQGSPVTQGALGHLYDVIADYAATVVFLCVTVAAVRRIAFKPARYAVPARFGKGHPVDAIFLLALIAILMVAESLFEASHAAMRAQLFGLSESLPVLSLSWALKNAIALETLTTLRQLYLGAYLLDVLTFYFLLCYRPFGIQFHVETSLFNIFFAKLDRGTVKPVRWGLSDEQLDQVESFGVKKFEDFTWKHMLDFYSCADCGRCSDNCPSNAVGRPLSPRFFTTKARDYLFRQFPVMGSAAKEEAFIGGLYSEDEIWSCTTCGACEEECPLLIEYIDKIVDIRRGLVDEGNVPKSIQKALKALASRGNPYAKLEKKRADWAKGNDFRQVCDVNILNGDSTASTLYFVDSITSFDDRMQSIGRATARLLSDLGKDFAILGAAEKDSGHEVRRFGEEALFLSLRDDNAAAIRASGARQIVTADPHAFNALKHDYQGLPPVYHISQVLASECNAGNLKLNPLADDSKVFAYHDPCYLGRHNQIYDEPRQVLDSIPGLKRVEMSRCRDRSFCCGGGGLMLFYEPKEEQRMGVKRVEMAAEAGANVIVSACPFCMVNIEDAIKVAGMENKMAVIDLVELVDQQMVRERPQVAVMESEEHAHTLA